MVPRGAGSNLCAATVAERGGIVLVLTRMDQILEVSADELLARVETGVTTTALSDAAAAKGLLYAPDPGSRTVSTVGGNVATCAGGLRGLKYGVTRNYVLGATAVLPTGEIIQTGGRLWKDVAGYDLTRLLTGSEGTLGVLTEVTVALLPHAGHRPTPASPTSRRWPTPAAPSARSSAPGSCRPRWSSSTPSASAPSRSTRTSGCATTRGRCCCSATTAPRTSSTATWTRIGEHVHRDRRRWR